MPYLVHAAALVGTGQLPKFEQDLFAVRGDPGFYLIPTAEVPVTNLVRDQILAPETLAAQIRGAHAVLSLGGGRGRKGHARHDPPASIREGRNGAHRAARGFLCGARGTDRARRGGARALELPYRVIALCAGDTGFSAAKTYDLEVWLPSQQRYREISSCSNCESFQARRLQARWRNPATGKPELVHTLNGRGSPWDARWSPFWRTINSEDGTVAVPSVLVPYMGGVSPAEVPAALSLVAAAHHQAQHIPEHQRDRGEQLHRRRHVAILRDSGE